MPECIESLRRKPGARGRLATLADGQVWLLSEPTYRAGSIEVTSLNLDNFVDQIHEQIIVGDNIALVDILSVARILLLSNYELTEAEVENLLEVESGEEADRLAGVVLEAVFGGDQKVRGYLDWVRASLLANGLGSTRIPSSALHDVLTILVATNRTVPPSQFIDACRVARDRDLLERIV